MSNYLDILVTFIRICGVLTVVPFCILASSITSQKKIINKELRPIFFYLIFDIIVLALDIVGRVIYHNNSFAYHISTFFDVTTLCWFFIIVSPTNRHTIIIYSWLIFAAVAFVDALWLDQFMTHINIISRMTGNTLLTVLALHHVWNLKPSVLPERNPKLIVCAMILIYYTCTTFMFVVQELIPPDLLAGLSARKLGAYSMLLYPLVRTIQVGLLIHLLSILQSFPSPRRALPRWLRFRVGWRPPVHPYHYRILPPHLAG